MILVTGATGTIGREVIAQLAGAGERVRAMTRDPAKARALSGELDVVRGDFEDGASLRAALEGIDRVFLLSAPWPTLPAHDLALIAAAREARVRRVVKLSAFGAERTPRLSVGAWHHPGEQALQESGLAWTILRPAGFASNALRWAPAIRAGSPVPVQTGEGRQGIVDPRDVAAVAVAALTSDRHEGRAYTLTGSELLSAGEQLAILGRALGREVATAEVSIETMREQLLASGMGLALVDAFAEGTAYLRDGKAATLTEDLRTVLGRAPRRFQDWVRDHLGAFG